VADLSTLPQEVNVDHYAGDTLTLHVAISTVDIAGRQFFAQIRKTKNAAKIDATFTVVVTPSGCDLVLSAAASRALTKHKDYEGVWDVQLSTAAGVDPVVTLGFGEMRLHSDVTRIGT
jgi:hypothetical protein